MRVLPDVRFDYLLARLTSLVVASILKNAVGTRALPLFFQS